MICEQQRLAFSHDWVKEGLYYFMCCIFIKINNSSFTFWPYWACWVCDSIALHKTRLLINYGCDKKHGYQVHILE